MAGVPTLLKLVQNVFRNTKPTTATATAATTIATNLIKSAGVLGATAQQPPSPTLQQQPSPAAQQQPLSTLQQQPSATLQQQPLSTLQQLVSIARQQLFSIEQQQQQLVSIARQHLSIDHSLASTGLPPTSPSTTAQQQPFSSVQQQQLVSIARQQFCSIEQQQQQLVSIARQHLSIVNLLASTGLPPTSPLYTIQPPPPEPEPEPQPPPIKEPGFEDLSDDVIQTLREAQAAFLSLFKPGQRPSAAQLLQTFSNLKAAYDVLVPLGLMIGKSIEEVYTSLCRKYEEMQAAELKEPQGAEPESNQKSAEPIPPPKPKPPEPPKSEPKPPEPKSAADTKQLKPDDAEPKEAEAKPEPEEAKPEEAEAKPEEAKLEEAEAEPEGAKPKEAEPKAKLELESAEPEQPESKPKQASQPAAEPEKENSISYLQVMGPPHHLKYMFVLFGLTDEDEVIAQIIGKDKLFVEASVRTHVGTRVKKETTTVALHLPTERDWVISRKKISMNIGILLVDLEGR